MPFLFATISQFLETLAAAIVGGLVTAVGGWFLVTRTEWYRRLSRWEPYGEKLWARQLESYVKVSQAATDAVTAAAAVVRHGEARMRFYEAHQVLSDLYSEIAVLLSPRFNEIFGEFISALVQCFVADRSSPEYVPTTTKVTELGRQLIEAAREGVGTEPLGEQISQAIGKTWKETGELRREPNGGESSEGQ